MSAEEIVSGGQTVTQVGTWIMGLTGGISAVMLIGNMRNEDKLLTKFYLTTAMIGVGVGLAVTGVGNAISSRASHITNDLTKKEALDVSGRILLGVGLPTFAVSSYIENTTGNVLLASSVILLTAGGVSLGISQNAGD